MTNTLATYANIERLISVAAAMFDPTDLELRNDFGRFWDTELVQRIELDYFDGYADGQTSEPVVKGNWNNLNHKMNDDATKLETLPGRLCNALERIGVEAVWCDEYTACGECMKAIRTQPDSYQWVAEFTYLEDAGYVCTHCLQTKYGVDALESFINEPHKAVTFFDAAQLESFGFERHPDSDAASFESGWHPGQTDNPETILASILESRPDAQVVFLIDESSQFSVSFSAFVRTDPDAEHSAECVGCEHDCPWNGNPMGAPFCTVCDDHMEASADEDED